MTVDTLDWEGIEIANGRYTISGKLGEGGMGFVYRAWDGNLETDVVIKVPRRAMLDDPEFAQRFALEIKSLVRLQHPNIVKVSDVGEHDGLPFAVMQFLSGGDLTDRQTKDAEGNLLPLPPEDIANWLPGVAEALDFIHAQDFIHRDVKPANILFDSQGNVYLSDFGVAKVVAENTQSQQKLTGTGMVMGTPEYMAPELIMEATYDGRVDQYALAIAVHELLCGRVPFQGPTPAAILVSHSTQLAQPLCELYPSIPVAVSDAVMKGLAKDPNDRYENCRSFARAVCDVIAQQTFSVDPASTTTGAAQTATRAGGTTRKAIKTLVFGSEQKAAARTPGARRLFLALRVTGLIVGLALAVALVVMGVMSLGGTEGLAEFLSGLSAAQWTGIGFLLATLIGLLVWLVFVRGRKKAAAGQAVKVKRPPMDAKTKFWVSAAFSTAASVAVVVWVAQSQPPLPKVKLTAEDKVLAVPQARYTDGDGHPNRDFTNSLGMNMVAVLPGRFRSTVAAEEDWEFVDRAYWIADKELSVAQYFLFLEENFKNGGNRSYEPAWFNGSASGFDENNLPIVGIRHDAAVAFCRWLTQNEGGTLEYRLPTREEWVCAYRGGTETDYYWGDEFDEDKANSDGKGDGFAKLAPVGEFDPETHPWKLMDMSGNAWEMTTTPGLALGGGWDSKDHQQLSAAGTSRYTGPHNNLGFRIIARRKSQ